VIPITLGRAAFRDKVYACWLGKNIGGTLGAPYECKTFVNNLTFYDPVPHAPLPNDDLDLQLVWLAMLEERGPAVSVADFAVYWKALLCAYPWNEYGFCMRNLERGLMPPMSGWFENYYVDEMGSPIRSEIWACVAPADPGRAAALAWMDSAMDHAGGEGMWGEMFWAAVESAAFVESDPLTLITIGLAMIPPACNIARVIREVLWCHAHGVRWAEARDRVVRIYGNAQPCNAIQNHGFTIIGWLYGEDFGDRLCKAVNCAYDTDCTGATLGSVLGILGGTAGIPRRWSDPVGTGIVLHKFTGLFDAPATVDELTDRTIAVAERFVPAEGARVVFGERTALPADTRTRLFRAEEAAAASRRDLKAATVRAGEVEITLHYGGDPVLLPGVGRAVSVSCRKGGTPVTAETAIAAPAGWQLDDGILTAPDFTGAATLTVTAVVDGHPHTASFTVFSPTATDGFPSARNIECCDACHGRKGTCACARQVG